MKPVVPEEAITCHHGSMSREERFSAEQRLKAGKLRALVATASLELGLDIGAVDLVCQLGALRSIGTFLQRAGRARHTVDGIPRVRLFPLRCDELIDQIALLRAFAADELDLLRVPTGALDILAQQIVASVASEEGKTAERKTAEGKTAGVHEGWDELDLFRMLRSAYPYRGLRWTTYQQLLAMLSEGFAYPNRGAGRQTAYLYRYRAVRRLRARRGARLVAIMNGGAIGDQGEYRVLRED